MGGDQAIDREFVLTLPGGPITLKRPTVAMELAYVKHLRMRAVADLAADLKDAPANLRGVYADLTDRIASKITEGNYDWGAPGFYASLGSPRNVQAFVYWWLQQHRGELNGAALSEEKIAALWPTHRDEFNRVVNEVFSDPNSGGDRPAPPVSGSP